MGTKYLTSSNNTYKIYSALLTQSLSGDPVTSVLENTLGNLIWTRTSTGSYLATLSAAFPDSDKVRIFVNQSGIILIGGGDSVYTYAYVNDSNTIILETLISSNYQDGQLFKTPIEIKVYN